MARFLPSVPQNVNPEIIRILDTEFNDEFVIIAGKISQTTFVILHPSYNALVLEIDEKRWDNYLGELKSLEMTVPADFVDAEKILWVPYPMKEPVFSTATEMSPAYLVSDDVSVAASAFAWIISQTEHKKLGEKKINEIITKYAPGAPGYKPGVITPQQENMRADVVDSVPEPDKLRMASEDVYKNIQMNEMSILPSNNGRIVFLRKVIENIVGDTPIIIYHCEVFPYQVVHPKFFLPALLVSAAEDWSLLYDEKKKLGFNVSLKKDAQALFGFGVSDIKTSTNLILALTITHKILSCYRETERGPEYVLDEIGEQFQSWAWLRGYKDENLASMTLRTPITLSDVFK